MELSDKQLRFIRKRKQLISYWKYGGIVVCVVFVAFVGWMYYRVPLFVNPYEVISRLQHSTLDRKTMMLMAGMLPISVLTTLLVLGAIIIFLYAAMANERRYIEIIDQIIDNKQEKLKRM